MKLYKNQFESKGIQQSTYGVYTSIKGNVLESRSTKPEIEIKGEEFQMPKSLLENSLIVNFVLPLLVALIGGLTLRRLIRYFNKK